jgi:hypothetical protein
VQPVAVVETSLVSYGLALLRRFRLASGTRMVTLVVPGHHIADEGAGRGVQRAVNSA